MTERDQKTVRKCLEFRLCVWSPSLRPVADDLAVWQGFLEVGDTGGVCGVKYAESEMTKRDSVTLD